MVTDIVFSSEEINLNVDDTETIVAEVLPEDADNKTLEWSSDSPSIVSVTVDEDTHSAVVKGVSEGEAIITAAATDGSGVSAMCNVVVSGSQPYPENANYYVPSVQDCKRPIVRTPTNHMELYFIDGNGDRIEIWYVDYTKEEYDAGHIRIKLKNVDTGEFIDDYTFTGKNDKYIIGSLTNKSYLEIYQSSNPYSSEHKILLTIHYENEDFITTGETNFKKWSSTEQYMSNVYFYFTDIGLKRRLNINHTSNEFNYYNGSYYKYNKCTVYYDRAYDENGVETKFSDLGLSTSQDWLFKFNIIKNGVKIREDYKWFIKTGDVYTRVERGAFKLQNSDGTYTYTNGYGALITPEEFPEGEVTYEFTFDITNVT